MLGEFKIITTITPRDDSSVNRYLAEVNKISMISPEREVELAQRIHKGDEEAVKELVLANLRFAVSVAKKYQYTGMPFADLVAEANCGLIKAAQMFDYTKGFKFSPVHSPGHCQLWQVGETAQQQAQHTQQDTVV